MELIKLVYRGKTKKYCIMPEYTGIVEPGKDYETTQEVWDNELKNSPIWELKKKVKTEIKKENIKKDGVKNG